MTPGSAEAVRLLDVVARICGNTVHALRTPLGVTLGALDDLAKGHHLTPAEIEDARDAAQRMAEMLHTLASFADFPFDLSAICPLTELAAAMAPGTISGPEQELSGFVRGSLPTLACAIRSVAHALEDAVGGAPPELRLDTAASWATVSITGALPPAWPEEAFPLHEMALRDPSTRALGTVYAAHVLAAIGGDAAVTPSGSGRVMVILKIPRVC